MIENITLYRDDDNPKHESNKLKKSILKSENHYFIKVLNLLRNLIINESSENFCILGFNGVTNIKLLIQFILRSDSSF